jgi:hypothetical protein
MRAARERAALSGASWPGTTTGTDPVYVWVKIERFVARHLKEKNRRHMAARNKFEWKILMHIYTLGYL